MQKVNIMTEGMHSEDMLEGFLLIDNGSHSSFLGGMDKSAQDNSAHLKVGPGQLGRSHPNFRRQFCPSCLNFRRPQRSL